MKTEKLDFAFDKEKGRKLLQKIPVVIHCHHYNCFLQRTLEDALGNDFRLIQANAAKIETEKLLENTFADEPDYTASDVFDFATKIYKKMGMGIIDFSKITEDGGSIPTPVSHYSFTWLEKFGPREKPVCYFTCGFILATVCNAYKKDINYYKVFEESCLVQNAECIFKLEVA